jgi:hypothetical protein
LTDDDDLLRRLRRSGWQEPHTVEYDARESIRLFVGVHHLCRNDTIQDMVTVNSALDKVEKQVNGLVNPIDAEKNERRSQNSECQSVPH